MLKNNFDMHNCTMCPRNCHADRSNGNTGFCGQTADIKVARAALHFWEEPCISGSNGSGAIFFSGCNMRCIFCQNADLSASRLGLDVSPDRLLDIMLELQEQGANNINLVTPGHFIAQLIPVLEKAKVNGLNIPVVYNTGSYEYADSIRQLDGLIDIYMPDLKYYDRSLSLDLSQAPDYFERAAEAISEMYRQTGPAEFRDEAVRAGSPSVSSNYSCTDSTPANKIMTKGLLIRHLVLPRHTKDSMRILEYIHDTYGDDIYLSIMNQYTPMSDRTGLFIKKDYPELNRTLTEREYDKVINYACDIGIANAFIQEGATFKESFIPMWDYTGVLPAR